VIPGGVDANIPGSNKFWGTYLETADALPENTDLGKTYRLENASGEPVFQVCWHYNYGIQTEHY